MKRPLMAVCMCFVIVIAILLPIRKADETKNSGRPPGLPVQDAAGPPESGMDSLSVRDAAGPPEVVADGGTITVTGHVYQKDTKYFYLDSVIIQNQAAGQQQNFSLSENLICEYEENAPKIGSFVQVSGTFKYFNRATNPGEFDAEEYYHSIKICGRLQSVTELREGDGYSVWQETLFELREYFRERLYNIFTEKEASIMTAMLLGDKSGLDDSVKDLYQDNGIIHILSISGLHITIIGMSIYKVLRRVGIPIWIAALMGGTVLVMYGVMTGMSVSATRAIGMFLIRMAAEIVGRTYDMLTALAICGAGMIGVNPLNLQNAGFLLSYGAIVGIGVLYPALLRENAGKTEQSIISGLSITLTTLPIQLWFYYEVPTYSIFLNLLVLPFMTVVMLSGLIAMIVPGLGIVGTIDCIILSGYEWLCKFFEKIPYSKWNPGRPEIWQIVVYYVFLILVLFMHWFQKDMFQEIVTKMQRGKLGESRKEQEKEQRSDQKSGKGGAQRSDQRKNIVIPCIKYLFPAMAVVVLGTHFPKQTTITFLDVGQGDCICVQLATGEVYLFDCGSSSRNKIGEYVLLPYLQYYGIDYIDAVFVSHGDEDHCNGVEELLANGKDWGITVGALVLPDIEERVQKLVEDGMQEIAGEYPVQILTIKAGDSWQVNGTGFLCLHPPKNYSNEDSNAASQCFYIEFENGSKLLLTGDVEDKGEELLLAQLQKRNIRDVTFLKVAHHGSRYSGSEEFLAQVNPQVAVISCGKNNSYGHPHEETLERLSEEGAVILTTPEYGAITVEVGRTLRIQGWKYQ